MICRSDNVNNTSRLDDLSRYVPRLLSQYNCGWANTEITVDVFASMHTKNEDDGFAAVGGVGGVILCFSCFGRAATHGVLRLIAPSS